MGQTSLYIIGILFGLVNGSTRFIWGFLMDKFNFKILMVIISIIEMTVCTTIYWFADNPPIFVIENLLVATCLSGTFTTITPLFNKIFNTLGAEMYGLTGIFIGIASFLGPVLTKLIASGDKDDNNDKKYLILYLTGGGICLIKFVFLFFFDENSKFEFKLKSIILSPNEDLGNIVSTRTTKMEDSDT